MRPIHTESTAQKEDDRQINRKRTAQTRSLVVGSQVWRGRRCCCWGWQRYGRLGTVCPKSSGKPTASLWVVHASSQWRRCGFFCAVQTVPFLSKGKGASWWNEMKWNGCLHKKIKTNNTVNKHDESGELSLRLIHALICVDIREITIVGKSQTARGKMWRWLRCWSLYLCQFSKNKKKYVSFKYVYSFPFRIENNIPATD